MSGFSFFVVSLFLEGTIFPDILALIYPVSALQ